MNKLLTICIPTYNRAPQLNKFFNSNETSFSTSEIAIAVCDNNSNDDTCEVVQKWQKGFEGLKYYKNTENVGYDQNCLNAIALADTDYVWLFGDTYYVDKEVVNNVISLIKSNGPDAIVINMNCKVSEINVVEITNLNHLEKLSGLIASISTVIVRKNKIDLKNLERYVGCQYIQLGIFYEMFAKDNSTVTHRLDLNVKPIKSSLKKNWSEGRLALNIITEKWAEAIFMLPAKYPYSSKINALDNVGEITRLFTFWGIFHMRSNGAITIMSLIKSSRSVLFVVGYFRFFVMLLSGFIPKGILKAFGRVLRTM